MKRVSINGVELACRDESPAGAAGTPIVFLHAFPLNQTMWDEQAQALSSRRRVVTFDWRGFGQSAIGDDETTMNHFADDLASLLNHLGIERAIICGLSMGGYAAFAFYRKYAWMVSALILADTRATADTEEGKQTRREMAALARRSGPLALVETMVPRLLGETTLRDKPQIVERVRRMIESNSGEGIARASLAMAARNDSTDLLEHIDCPALVIVGAEDKLTAPPEVEKMSAAIRAAKLEIISAAGHLPNIEQPDDFNLIITKFVEEL
jgi:pimeloyl-ACP methyl ester carboxylesterase